MGSSVLEVSIFHHVCLVLLLLWLLSSFNCCHPVAYFISLIYLYLVHERHVLRLRAKLRFEERRDSNQRRVLSDSETVRWLNHALEKIWPVCMEEIVSQKILLPIIPWFLQKYKPWTVNQAVVQNLYMGRAPPMFTRMRVLHQSTGDDHLVLELGMNFRAADDMSAILDVKLTKRLGFGMWAKLHLMGMHVEGKVLIGVKFLRHWPFLGRLRVCFVEPPYFQMTVKPIFSHGLDVTEIPGIAGWLDKLLALAFEQTLVQPNMLVVDIEKFVSPQPESWFTVDEKQSVAYALVEVIEGTDMKPSDLNGLADPYVKGQLGPYRFRTKTQRKTLAPKWHEEFKVPICTWELPNVLAISVHDKDHFLDDTLGDCSITIVDDLRDGQRHDMWLPLQKVKMGRLHVSITVVEGNKKAQDQPRDGETLTDQNSVAIETVTAQNGSLSSGFSEKSPKAADKFEPIDVEGQEDTGIWVHHPGIEVSQVWEPRKGKNRLLDAHILAEGSDVIRSFKSSAAGSYKNDSSSTDESQEGNKGNPPNKMVRGLQKIGSMFHRSSGKEDSSGRGEESVPSPHANLKAVNTKERGVNLIVEVDDNNLSVRSPSKDSKAKGSESPEEGGSGQESPSKRNVKDMAKSFFKHTGKSARGVKRAFSRKVSKLSQGDAGSVVAGEDIAESCDEESLPSSAGTSEMELEVEGIPLDSKPISTDISDNPSHSQEVVNDQTALSDCPPKVDHPIKKVSFKGLENKGDDDHPISTSCEENEDSQVKVSLSPEHSQENLEVPKNNMLSSDTQ